MDDLVEGSKNSGTFTISPECSVYGELTLNGNKTGLYLRHEESFSTDEIIDTGFVRGILHDFTRVSLHDCITSRTLGMATRRTGSQEQKYFSAQVFPHYVLYGDTHIAPADRLVTAAHFVLSDATTLFYDFHAFGSVIDAGQFIEQIVNANRPEGKVAVGPYPYIQYHTGKREIFSVETLWGVISASHVVSPSLNSPRGVSITNKIYTTIKFNENLLFSESYDRVLVLCKFFGLLVGRSQDLQEFSVILTAEPGEEIPPTLRVYRSNESRHVLPGDESKVWPSDVLLDAIKRGDEFSEVFRKWIDRQDKGWRDARFRFFHSFEMGNEYSNDRLIGSANMFDILPSSATPPNVGLSDALQSAKETCRALFLQLPDSPERNSILGVLGRLGKSSLRLNIRHRARPVLDVVGEHFPDLFIVIDEAVNCRNHYVHGSPASFDYNANVLTQAFLTDTLEFVFAASDLAEAGWDIKSWCKSGVMAHPIGVYRVLYRKNLKQLMTLLKR